MPMILVKKNPRGKVIRELSSEEDCSKDGLWTEKASNHGTTSLANDLLREMREYDAWLQCDCIPEIRQTMNFAALKTIRVLFICPV